MIAACTYNNGFLSIIVIKSALRIQFQGAYIAEKRRVNTIFYSLQYNNNFSFFTRWSKPPFYFFIFGSFFLHSEAIGRPQLVAMAITKAPGQRGVK